jgi:hypothetical protein
VAVAVEPELGHRLRHRVRVLDAQHDVVEVVVEVGLALHEPERQPLGRAEQDDAVVAALELELRRQRRQRRAEVVDAKDHGDERAGLARALGGEQRQLEAPGVGAHERELVGALDDVHPEVPAGQVGDRVAVGDPERDVVERGHVHLGGGHCLHAIHPCAPPCPA